MSRVLTILLLLATSVAALWGGYNLYTDPTGALMNLTLEELRESPFKDYEIPGIFLFCVIGIGNILVAIITILRKAAFYIWNIVMGNVLIIWTLTQLFLFWQLRIFQIAFGIIGLVLFILGIINAVNERDPDKMYM